MFFQASDGQFRFVMIILYKKNLDLVIVCHGYLFDCINVCREEGRLKKKVAPLPTSASAHTRPPCRVIIRCTNASPTPVPSNSVILCRRWNTPNNLSAYSILNPTPLSCMLYIISLPVCREL